MTDVPMLCHRCGRELRPGEGSFHVVNIEAFADPTPPTISAEDLARDHRAEIERLVRKLAETPGVEAMDQVYRRLTLYLCSGCYGDWIENPAGDRRGSS